MEEIQTEIQDNQERLTEHHNGTITTAGTPVTVSTSAGRTIQSAYIFNPDKGPNANGPGDLLYVSWDGGTNYSTFTRGAWIIWSGKGSGTNSNEITLDSNNDGTKYEILLVS